MLLRLLDQHENTLPAFVISTDPKRVTNVNNYKYKKLNHSIQDIISDEPADHLTPNVPSDRYCNTTKLNRFKRFLAILNSPQLYL